MDKRRNVNGFKMFTNVLLLLYYSYCTSKIGRDMLKRATYESLPTVGLTRDRGVKYGPVLGNTSYAPVQLECWTLLHLGLYTGRLVTAATRDPPPPAPHYSTVTVLSMDGLHSRSVTDLVYVCVYSVPCYSPRHLLRSWMRPPSFTGAAFSSISVPSLLLLLQARRWISFNISNLLLLDPRLLLQQRWVSFEICILLFSQSSSTSSLNNAELHSIFGFYVINLLLSLLQQSWI